MNRVRIENVDKFVEEYEQYLQDKHKQTVGKLNNLVEKGKISIIRVSTDVYDISEAFKREVEMTLQRYGVPKESNVIHKLARFLNWNKMREGGSKEITDDELKNNHRMIIFYYSKPVAPYVVLDEGMLNDLIKSDGTQQKQDEKEQSQKQSKERSIISLGDYLLYKRFALLAQLAGKNLIIADESRHILKNWNEDLGRYPVLSSPVDDDLIIELKRRYGIEHIREVGVMYCDQKNIEWLPERVDVLTKLFQDNISFPADRLEIIMRRVERWIDNLDIGMLIAKYLILSQDIVLGKYRQIPDGYLHISMTSKKSGRYELKTTTDYNPNYGVTVAFNTSSNKELSISVVPLHLLLDYIESKGEKMKLLLYELQDGNRTLYVSLFAPEEFEPEHMNSLTKFMFEKSTGKFYESIILPRSNTLPHHQS